LVLHDELCPAMDGVTCLVPQCTAMGCGLRGICDRANPQCNGCADCSCNTAVNRCVPTCPS
jgi:hypothetical protein